MLTELLTRLEHDENCARTVVLVHHHRVAHPLGRLDLEQVPALHTGNSIVEFNCRPHDPTDGGAGCAKT